MKRLAHSGLLLSLFVAPLCHAQIATDGRLGPKQNLSGPNFGIPASLGKRVGNNLFHSFSTFHIKKNQSATFTGPGGIKNVLARVTGGEASKINGDLKNTIPGSDFYFINPAGVIFGPKAHLDMAGAFTVTTADRMELADGGHFDAKNPNSSVLTSADPSAFGFLAPHGKISIDGPLLHAKDGKPFTAAGGQIEMSNFASINLVSGDIILKSATDVVMNNAFLFTSGPDNGHISISAQNLTMNNGNVISESTGSAKGQGITISLGGGLEMANSLITAAAASTGAGGDVLIQAKSIHLSDETLITANASGAGKAGNISITADDVRLQSNTPDVFGALIASGPAELATGSGGNVVIHANRLALIGDSQIASSTNTAADSGNIDLFVHDLLLKSSDTFRSPSISSGTFKDTAPAGKGGRIHIKAERLNILNNGEIESSTFGPGQAGDILIRAERIRLKAREDPLRASFLDINTDSSGSGDAGRIEIHADSFSLMNGATVTSSAYDTGHGGSIAIVADRVYLKNQIALESAIATDTFGPGAGGDISIQAGSFRVNGGFAQSSISADSADEFGGHAGNIDIRVADTLSLVNGGRISTETLGAGAGGNITLQARSVLLEDEGTSVSAASSGAGPSGHITIDADVLRVLHLAEISATSLDSGVAGELVLNVGELRVHNASISAQAEQSSGGNITIHATRHVGIDHGFLTASAKTGGGTIFIDPPAVALNQSVLLANTDSGAGGTVRIDHDAFLRSDTTIDVSSVQGTSGTVQLTGPEINIAGSLVRLDSLLDAAVRLQQSCAALFGRDFSSFTVQGRGGVPTDEGSPLPSLDFIPRISPSTTPSH